MTQHILYVIIAFALSTVCGFVFIPMIINFCKQKGLYDMPDGRKVHKRAVPRLGGISFLPSMLLASVIVVSIYNRGLFSGQQIELSPWSLGFFLSLLIIYGTGLVDDLVGLGAKTKFLAQIVAATILPLLGLYINDFYGFLGIHSIPYSIGAPLTVFIIVYLCNAINLIDGIDGLSAGLSFIALSGFLFCFMREGLFVYSILIAGLMGVLVPFLHFNLFGKTDDDRQIFMGDSGSLTLGFILGFLFVKIMMNNPNLTRFSPDSMMLAYSLLIVPVFDVVRVSLVRIHHHTPIFSADKNHIHHKLMRAGLTQHQALVCILLLSLCFIGVNMLLWKCAGMIVLVSIDMVLWGVFHLIVDWRIVKCGRKVYLANQEAL